MPEVSGSCSSPTRSLLLLRTLPVNACTTRTQASGVTGRDLSADNSRKVAVETLDGQHQTMAGPGSIQQSTSSRDVGHVKSSPSHPVLLPTTVAAPGHKDSRRASSWGRLFARPVAPDAPRRTRRAASPNNGFSYGAVRSRQRMSRGNQKKAMSDSPVKYRISWFERLSRSTSSEASGKSKPHVTPASSGWENGARLSAPRRGARVLRKLSLGDRRRRWMQGVTPSIAVPTKSDNRSETSVFEIKNTPSLRGASRSEQISNTSQRASAFSLGSRLQKAPKLYDGPERQSSSATSLPTRYTCVDGPRKTAGTGMGGIAPAPTSHRALDYQTRWEPGSNVTAADTCSSLTPADKPQVQTARRLRLRYSNSFSASSTNKPAVEPGKGPSVASPILTPAPAHAQVIASPRLGARHNPTASDGSLRLRHPSLSSVSWGRRAAAAALDIGRKLRARKEGSLSSSSGLDTTSGHDIARAGGGVMYRDE